MFLDAPESYLQAIEGTEMYNAQKDGIYLVKGQMLATGGKEGLTVKTQTAAVILKPDAVAVIETHKAEPMRITVIDSAGPDGVVVKVGDSTYTVRTSEEVTVARESTSSPPAKGPLTGGVEVTQQAVPIHVMKVAVHLPEFIPKDPMIMCIIRHLGNYASIRSRIPKALADQIEKYRSQLPNGRKLGSKVDSKPVLTSAGENPAGCLGCHNQTRASNPIDRLKDAAASNEHKSTPAPVSEWQTVAYMPPSILPSGLRLLDGARLLQTASNWYALETGTALCEADELTRIDTSHGSVVARGGAAVMVCAEPTLTRILNLSDNRSGSVKAFLGKHAVHVPPGAEVAFVRGSRELAAELVMKDGLARRKVHVTDLSADEFLVRDQFSLVQALSKHPLLSMIRRSTRKSDQMLVEELVKTAAGLYMTTDRTGGPYYTPLVPGTGPGAGNGDSGQR